MPISSESCHECGRDIPNGLGEPLRACLWNVPAASGEHWGWVEVCPSCARRLRLRRAAILVVVSLVVGGLTAIVAYPLRYFNPLQYPRRKDEGLPGDGGRRPHGPGRHHGSRHQEEGTGAGETGSGPAVFCSCPGCTGREPPRNIAEMA
jgi:hypothetical protein